MNCPDCGSSNLSRLGLLPDVAFFAGRHLQEPLPGGTLLFCRRCDLRFRYPLLGVATYEELYDNLSVGTWRSASLREDQKLVQGLARDLVSAGRERPRVLDFGCYAGDLLAILPADLEKFGVEINAAAGALAAKRAGARVVRDLGYLSHETRFDLIVAMDVIEHVPSPRALMQRLVERLGPGGCLAITTGDAGNWLWRLLGSRWWYCYFPEHIAFVSRRWLQYHAPALGISVQQVRKFNYLGPTERPGIFRGWRRLLRYVLAPAAHKARQQRHFHRHGSDLGVPGIGLTRDHLLLVVTRRVADG